MQAFAISVGDVYYPVLTLPGRPKAILDKTAAAIYNTETRIVNRAVLRNKERFPSDFYFELTPEEAKLLSEIPIWDLAWNGGFLPKAFTAKGMNMLSTLLKSEVAIQRSVDIIRAFTALESVSTRDDQWDIITAKIIAAINNRLEDVRLFVNKKIANIEDRITHIEQELSIQQRTNSEVKDDLTTCITRIENDLAEIKRDHKAFVDKSSLYVDNPSNGVDKCAKINKCANESLIPNNTDISKESQIQDYIRNHGKITNREYRELFSISRRSALRELTELVDKNILAKHGKGRSVFYTLAQL